MKTYNFKVVVEPDGDRWHAYCPALQEYGAATWGHTEQEAWLRGLTARQLISALIRDEFFLRSQRGIISF